ncbi:MAG TPA: peptidylprolyl isomerase [Planctomycetota bacterium]|nr:peptidylprolyl isomerase [Planctomycetota bacterium]
MCLLNSYRWSSRKPKPRNNNTNIVPSKLKNSLRFLKAQFLAGVIIICGLFILASMLSVEKSQAAPSGPPLKLTATPAQTEVLIGDWIVITLTLTNMTAANMDIIKPILDFDSVSFQIKTTPLSNTSKSFVYSVITPSVYDHNRAKMARISLAAGAESKTTFNIPAVVLGLWEIKAAYKGAQNQVSSEALNIKVIPPKSDKAKDGELIAKIETSKGTMKCRFFFNDAPNTVMNFARLSKEGYYNKNIFHRIMKGFMVQSGCPKGDGRGWPGYSIKAEFNNHKHLKGTLSMAHGEPKDSAGSQFFICLDPQTTLDNKYAAFGELISGMDVLTAIGNIRTVANPNMNGELSKPTEKVTIRTISFEFKEIPTKK